MKGLMIVLTFLSIFCTAAFAQMGTGQGGGMMNGNSGWGMGYGGGFGIIYMLKRK